MKIKSGQTVKVMSGKDRGKTGKVIQVFPKLEKVVVEGVNQSFKHLKARGQQQGERVEYFGPIHVSNVKLVEEKKTAAKADAKKAKSDKKSDSKK